MLRHRFAVLLVLSLALLHPHAAPAQDQGSGTDPMMAAMMAAMTPGAPHHDLASRAGNWKMTSTFWMDPSQPPMVTMGTVSREAILGGRVLVERVKAEMMGMPFEGFGMSGYDNVTGRYWTTWNDNMSTALIHGVGTRQADGKLIYDAAIVDPMTKEQVKVRMVVTETADSENMEWWETRGGKELKTMEVKYERVK